jgi:hypothetical protein
MGAFSYLQDCFVDMPFGKKTDLTSGVEVDFDHIYDAAIAPAIEDAGLEPIRGDREQTGGIIHLPMFGRLLLSPFVVADLTLANPNVFYELGIRHTAKPFTTVPIYASIHPIPFDIGMVRAIPYTLENGKLSDEAAAKLKSDMAERLKRAIEQAASNDSPIFQLIKGFPALSLPPEIEKIFMDVVARSEVFRKELSEARARETNKESCAALLEIKKKLGKIKTAPPGALMDLMLSLRDASGWSEVVQLIDEFPEHLKSYSVVQQQRAMALNRRNQSGDRETAKRILLQLLEEKGPDPETLGLLGRLYKDLYQDLQSQEDISALAALDDAIDAYTRGFKSDPRDYYPGVNAITLLVERGDSEDEVNRLMPLVSFAVERKGALDSSDYWVRATYMELAVVRRDWKTVRKALPKVLLAATASWMIESTLKNLRLLQAAFKRNGEDTLQLDQVISGLQKAFDKMHGQETNTAKALG